jgi:uncharacterized protein YceK
MELAASVARQSGMMTRRQVRVTVVAGALCAALAGCGSVVASSADGSGPGSGVRAAATGSSGSSGSAGAPGAGSAVGCASVSQATVVTIRRSMHLVEPVRATGLTTTKRDPAMVRALFGDFCAAVRHADKHPGIMACPADFGISYTGTFYAGGRTLATFVYGASGCQSVTVTADGKRQSTVLFGTAAAAAPNLQTDMAAVLGVPKYAVSAPTLHQGGGPSK